MSKQENSSKHMFNQDSRLEVLLGREKNYENIKQELITKAKKELGDDIFKNYYLPLNFNFVNISQQIFYKHRFHQHSLPFSNEQIRNFITIPKVAINKPVYFNSHGKNIHGVYLLAIEDGKPILFALQIVRTCEYKDTYSVFSIKLDVCIQGKTWFSLLRLDAGGKTHLNYLKNGKPAHSANDITGAKSPHLHENSEECQVYFYDNLDYTVANSINIEYDPTISSKHNTFFKECMDFFLTYCNAKLKINDRVLNNYHFDEKTQLIDKDTNTIKNYYDTRSL